MSLSSWIGCNIGRYREELRAGEAIKLNTARAHVVVIHQAITNYFARYGKWPCDANGKPDVTYGPGNQSNIVNVLIGVDRKLNTNGAWILALDLKAYKNGEFRDPWGIAYYITFDTDFDGICTNSRWGAIPTNGPLVWSEGIGPIRSW